MSPQFKALALSQHIIERREFTEGHILSHLYAIQGFHLAMSSSYLNREDWTKQFTSKILQLAHSQWIFRNISFHDKKNGYLQNKTAETLADPYKGKTPLPRVPNYQEPFASRHPNTWNAKANQYLEHSPETHNHRIHSFPPIATE